MTASEKDVKAKVEEVTREIYSDPKVLTCVMASLLSMTLLCYYNNYTEEHNGDEPGFAETGKYILEMASSMADVASVYLGKDTSEPASDGIKELADTISKLKLGKSTE